MRMITSLQRNYVYILFPFTLLLLCYCLHYIFTTETYPRGKDVCDLWRDKISADRDYNNTSRPWWWWACLIEREWEKGNEYNCRDTRRIGNYYICYDKPYKPEPPCLVYSFGINHDFRFDDEMAEAGCEVYSFDPSMGVADHQRSERVRFLNLGISTVDSDNFDPLIDQYTAGLHQNWKIRKLSSIRKMLGHENRPLDVLKMDVETYEWAIIQQLLKEGIMKSVRQLALEWHIFPNDPMRTEFYNMYETFMNLQRTGFRQFYVDPGHHYHTKYHFKCQTDSSLLNILYAKN